MRTFDEKLALPKFDKLLDIVTCLFTYKLLRNNTPPATSNGNVGLLLFMLTNELLFIHIGIFQVMISFDCELSTLLNNSLLSCLAI